MDQKKLLLDQVLKAYTFNGLSDHGKWKITVKVSGNKRDRKNNYKDTRVYKEVEVIPVHQIATMECTGSAGKIIGEGYCAMIGGVSIKVYKFSCSY